METQQVLDALKPKAASFGFNDEELREASEKIAELHPEEATEEEVAKVVDNHLPFLKLSQSAANRSFERMKLQFEKENPKPKKTSDKEDEEDEDEEGKGKKKTVKKEETKDEESDALKKLRKDIDDRLKVLEDENKALKAEKAAATFRQSVITALEGVDESYYSLALESAKFEKQEDVDNFVKKVKDGWDAMSKKLKIGNLSSVKPPKGGGPAPDKPSQDVKDRIERRKKSGSVASPIRGIEPKK